MYHHIKKLMYTVRVDEPDPNLETCYLNSLAARTAIGGGCNTPFRG